MRIKNIKKHKLPINCIVLIFTVTLGFSQVPPAPQNPPPPVGLPIDGGVTLLLAAAAAYGVKKSIDKE